MSVNEESVFAEAMEKQAPHDRAAFLDHACAGNPGLRQSVESLLSAYDAGQFLEAPAPGLDATIGLTPTAESPGAEIGPYKLLEQVGEGGMGLVFMADQLRPVRRRVALKIIKPGMDSQQVIARFEAERQALALMDHANIARVFDAGTTASGRPYFVMELVRGIPITDYCDEHKLAIRQRLELFVQVCQAVQHAHQKGVIHRDLKPSNVLVAHDDTVPLPKIIDFGIAKATSQPLTERTLFTALAQVVGTPLYMSPEQAALNHLDVDTRSDVYSLGVLLYELLTGTTPFEQERLRQAGLDEVRRIIREEEPPRPSTRVSTLGAALTTVSQRRSVDPRRMSVTLRGELDWIVMKSMEKDRQRRYESASALAADVGRYLKNEAVEACPPSASYRLRKFAWRNRAAMLTATLVSAALLLGMVVSMWQVIRANGERDNAVRAREAEAQQRDRALAAEKTARMEADKSIAINQFLIEDLLVQAEPDKNAADKQVTLLEVLDRSAQTVASRFRDQPLVEAALHRTIGNTYHGLGAFDKSERHWRAALEIYRLQLGPDNQETLSAMCFLGHMLWHLGQYEEGLALLRPGVECLRRVAGDDQPDTLTSMKNLALAYQSYGRLPEALPLFEETLKLMKAKLGPDHRETLATMSNLAEAYRAAGRLQESLLLHEKTLKLVKAKLGPKHSETLNSTTGLAWAYLAAGRMQEALALVEETLNLRKATLGPKHPDTLTSMNSLAGAYHAAGRMQEAVTLYEETLSLRKATLGPEHPNTLVSMNNLALAYQACGRLPEALLLLEETLSASKVKLGPDHPNTLKTINNLALAYKDTGRLPEALPLFEEALKLTKVKVGPEHPDTVCIMGNLAAAYLDAKQPDEALPLLADFLAGQRTLLGSDDPGFANSLALFGHLLLKHEQYVEAEKVLHESLRIREQKQPDDWKTFNTRSMLGGSLAGQKKYAEAEPLLLAGYEGMNNRESTIPAQGKVRLTEALERLVQLYDAWGQKETADEWRKRLAEKKQAIDKK